MCSRLRDGAFEAKDRMRASRPEYFNIEGMSIHPYRREIGTVCSGGKAKADPEQRLCLPGSGHQGCSGRKVGFFMLFPSFSIGAGKPQTPELIITVPHNFTLVNTQLALPWPHCTFEIHIDLLRYVPLTLTI